MSNLLTMLRSIVIILLISHINARGRSPEIVCEGKQLNLECPQLFVIEILSANYGRTNGDVCNPKRITIDETNCISFKSKNIIETKCNNKRYCYMRISDSSMGGDPCPGTMKYADIIYRCVRIGDHATRKPYVPRTRIIIRPTKENSTAPSTLFSTVETMHGIDKVMQLNETVDTKPIMRKKNGNGFFRSMFILMSLIKDKPKHSMLSVLTGVAAGIVIILISVLACVCWSKAKEKKAGDTFNSNNKPNNSELEKNGLLNGTKERQHSSSAQSTRSEDHKDSPLGDDVTLDHGKSNEFEMSNDMAYLDSYLEEFNKGKSVTRPSQDTHGSFKMSRRAHNDGSKGRSYHYDNDNDQLSTTFTS